MNAYLYENLDQFMAKQPIGIPKIPAHLEHPEKITQFGNTILWVGFAAMAAGVILFSATTAKTAYKYRSLHVTTLFVNVIAAISYYAMATGVGHTFVHSHGRSTWREIFYARYIDWALTTPLLLLDLTLVAGMAPVEIVTTIFADLVMIATGLVGGLHPSLTYRWGFFAFSCLAYLWVVYAIVGSARSTAALRSPKVGNFYNQISVVLVVVWSLYPVVWGFAEGSGKLSADHEVLAFAILDIIAKPVWGAWLVFATPEEGHVVLADWLAAPLGSVSGGGYGSVPGDDA